MVGIRRLQRKETRVPLVQIRGLARVRSPLNERNDSSGCAWDASPPTSTSLFQGHGQDIVHTHNAPGQEDSQPSASVGEARLFHAVPFFPFDFACS